MPSTIGTWTDKKMARRIGDAANTSELPDADTGDKTGLNTLALRAESEIALLTNKNNWTSSDDGWDAIQELATLKTAIKVLRALYADDKHLDKMRELNRETDKIVENIKRGQGLAGDNPAVISAVSTYTTKGLRDKQLGDGSGTHHLSDF